MMNTIAHKDLLVGHRISFNGKVHLITAVEVLGERVGPFGGEREVYGVEESTGTLYRILCHFPDETYPLV